MHIKRFLAPTLKAAMNAVKMEFGTDALILNTKRLSTDPGKSFEVVAAIDFDIEKLAPSPEPVVELKDLIVEPGPLPPPVAALDSDEIRKLVSSELGDIKEMLMTITAAAETPISDAVRALAKEMIANGIEKGLAKRMLAKTCTGVKVKRTKDYLRLRLRDFFAEVIKVSDPLASGRVACFIGPPGVGKTTTIAKLAAIHTLKKRRAALLTMDNYRIGATEQLKIYGKIVGIPVDVARTPSELSGLIRAHSDKDLILIDTAGRGGGDKEHFKRLRELADIEPAIKFNLVLNSQTRDDALAGAVRAYDDIPVDSLTFTKLDEGTVYGPIFNTMMQAGVPVAYTTAGQRVPEDIDTATREGLLNYILPNQEIINGSGGNIER